MLEWTEGAAAIKPAVFFADLRSATKMNSKQVGAVRRAALAAMTRHKVDRAVVVGLPNVGKSSLIVPLTRNQTKQVCVCVCVRGFLAAPGLLSSCCKGARFSAAGVW